MGRSTNTFRDELYTRRPRSARAARTISETTKNHTFYVVGWERRCFNHPISDGDGSPAQQMEVAGGKEAADKLRSQAAIGGFLNLWESWPRTRRIGLKSGSGRCGKITRFLPFASVLIARFYLIDFHRPPTPSDDNRTGQLIDINRAVVMSRTRTKRNLPSDFRQRRVCHRLLRRPRYARGVAEAVPLRRARVGGQLQVAGGCGILGV